VTRPRLAREAHDHRVAKVLLLEESSEVEAGDQRGWTGGDKLKDLDWEAWSESEWGLDGVRAAHSRDADPQEARRLWDTLAGASGGVWRLSVRRDHPHLEVHVLPPAPGSSSERLVEAFRSAGRIASGGR
jgi:hypothetical protein